MNLYKATIAELKELINQQDGDMAMNIITLMRMGVFNYNEQADLCTAMQAQKFKFEESDAYRSNITFQEQVALYLDEAIEGARSTPRMASEFLDDKPSIDETLKVIKSHLNNNFNTARRLKQQINHVIDHRDQFEGANYFYESFIKDMVNYDMDNANDMIMAAFIIDREMVHDEVENLYYRITSNLLRFTTPEDVVALANRLKAAADENEMNAGQA